MKPICKMMMILGTVALVGACSEKKAEQPFRYTVDSFADLKVMRYQVPGWDSLSLKQKEYAYHLAEAAKYGRDILWDQNSFNKDFPAGGRQQADQHLQDSALACTRRSDDRHGLAFFHFQIDTLQHLLFTKSKLQPLQGDYRFSHNASLIYRRTTVRSESNRR